MNFSRTAWIAAAAAMVLTSSAQAAFKDMPAAKALYDKAKSEGSVAVWGTTGGAVSWIPKAFNAVFPDIKVEFHGENDITTKVISEARAGRNQVDVFLHSLTGTLPLVQRDLIADVDWAGFGLSKEQITFGGKAAYTYNIAYSVAYSSDRVKLDDVPTKWADVTDPKFKGKTVSSLFLLPRLVGALSLTWGRDKAIQFARDLTVTNATLLTRAPREPIIASGERLYGVGEIDSQVMRWQQSGMKIGWVVPEPVVLGQFDVAILAKAPHPNAARLLAGWLVSPEGKKAQEEAVLTNDFGPTGTLDIAKKMNAKQVEVIYDTVELMERRERAIAEMGPIVAGQK